MKSSEEVEIRMLLLFSTGLFIIIRKPSMRIAFWTAIFQISIGGSGLKSQNLSGVFVVQRLEAM
jgi:hypothetical protein